MNIFSDTTFNGIKNYYAKTEAKYKASAANSNGGSLLDVSIEKKFKNTITYWNKMLEKNGKQNVNINNLYDMFVSSKGDPNKLKNEIISIIKTDYSIISNIFKNTKNKNITDYSSFSIYKQAYETLFDPKNVSAFKKAYELREKSKNKPNNIIYIIDLFFILWVILVFVLIYHSVSINTVTFNVLGITGNTKDADFKQGTFLNNQINKSLESILSSIQKEQKGFLSGIGFASIEISLMLNTIKNPTKEIVDCVKKDEEMKKKIASAESLDMVEKNKAYYEMSKECYIADRSMIPNRGNEEFVTVALVLIGAIVGFVLLINIIRRAIYQIGTIYIDVVGMIMVENECLRMNIKELQEKMDKETDPKAKKKWQSIIDKQLKWNARFEKFINDARGESTSSAYEAEEEIVTQDTQTEPENTGDDDYEILL